MKDKKIAKTMYYRENLRKYILENLDTYFSKENEADSFADFQRFPEKLVDRNHLCLPDEPMLIDRQCEGEHMYCICTINKNNKITSQYPVMRVDEIPYGKWRNGYFLLPVLDANQS